MDDMDLLMRAEAYRKTMVPRADVEQPYPMWYGWVINEAWLAGYAAAQAACPPREPTRAMIAAAVSATGDEPDDGRIMARVIWRAMHDTWTEQTSGPGEQPSPQACIEPGDAGPLDHMTGTVLSAALLKEQSAATPSLSSSGETLGAAQAVTDGRAAARLTCYRFGTLGALCDDAADCAHNGCAKARPDADPTAELERLCPKAPCEYCLQWLARRTERAEAERNRCALLARVRSEKIGEQQKEIDTLTAIVRAADMMRRHFVTYAGDQWVNASMARDAYDAARAKVKP